MGRFWISVVLSLGLTHSLPVVAVPTSVPDTTWQSIRQRRQLRVAIDPSLGSPYLFTDPASRTYRGFEWDIIQALGEQLKVTIRPVYIPWGGQLEALDNQEVDLILGGRETAGLNVQKFLATQPYYWSPQRLLVRTADKEKLTNLSQLLGQKVGILVDSTGAALLEAYNRNRGNAINLFASSQPERLFQQLRVGQLDAVLIDQPVAVAQTKKGDLALVGSGLLPTPLVAIVTARSPILKDAIDQALIRIQKDGSWKNILEAWQLWDSALIPLALPKD